MQYINCLELLFLINSVRLCKDKYKIALDRKLILSFKLLPKWIACCKEGFAWKTPAYWERQFKGLLYLVSYFNFGHVNLLL